MKIKEISISGFGAFSGYHLDGITAGLNLFFGENEAGKSTLLHFIRTVLFDFPKHYRKFYPPLDSRKHGGSIAVESILGPALIERHAGPGNKVLVTVEQGLRSGSEELLAQILGASGSSGKALFESVYAFGLAELTELKELQREEIRDRIYQTALGVHHGSLTALTTFLGDAAETLFRPKASKKNRRGSIPTLFEQLDYVRERERAAELLSERYSQIRGELDLLSRGNEEKMQRSRKAASRLKVLEHTLQSRADFFSLQHVEEKLRELAEFKEIDPELGTVVRGLERSFRENQIELEASEEQRRRLEQKLADLERFLGRIHRRGELQAIVNQEPAIAAVRAELEGKLGELRELSTQLETLQEELGDYSLEAVHSLDLSVMAQGNFTDLELRSRTLQAQQRALVESCAEERANLARIEDQASVLQEGQQAEIVIGEKFSALILLLAAAIVSLFGVAALFFDVTFSQRLTWLSCAAAVLGLFLMRSIRRFRRSAALLAERSIQQVRSEALQRDRDNVAARLEKLEGQANSVRVELEEVRSEIERYLPQRSGGERLPLHAIALLRNRFVDAKEHMKRKALLERDIGRLRERIVAHDQSFQKLCEDLGILIWKEVELTPARLPLVLEEVEELYQKWVQTKAHLENSTVRCQELQAKREACQRQITDALQKSGVDTPDQLFSLVTRNQERIELRAKRAQLQENLARFSPESAVGAELAGEFVRPEEDLQAELAELKISQSGWEKENEEDLVRMVELRHELREVESATELPKLRTERASIEQRIIEQMHEWCAYNVALKQVEETRRFFETERQPAIIRMAQEIFCRVAGGRYKRIFVDAETSSIRVEESSGRLKEVADLSTGTRELLFLALRLGYIAYYEEHQEPLPIVMDDILVNLDRQRAGRMVELLSEFSRERQLLFFTCHQHMLDLFTEAAGNQLNILKLQCENFYARESAGSVESLAGNE